MVKKIIACLVFFCSISVAALNYDVKAVFTLNTEIKSGSNLYFLHNTSDQSIWLMHPHKHIGASAGWVSLIDANRWTAIWVSKRKFQLACQLKNSQKKVPCNKFLGVKQKPIQRSPTSAYGQDFWVAENLSKADLIKVIKQRGFVFTKD